MALKLKVTLRSRAASAGPSTSKRAPSHGLGLTRLAQDGGPPGHAGRSAGMIRKVSTWSQVEQRTHGPTAKRRRLQGSAPWATAAHEITASI